MRYIGNKTKLLDEIEAFVLRTAGLTTGTLLDAFAGTASVSRRFRDKGWRVSAADLLMSSYVRQRAFLHCEEPRLGLSLERRCDALNHARLCHGIVYRQFSDAGRAERLYFSRANAARIDGAWVQLIRWWRDDEIDEDAFYLLLCAILEASDKVANISGIYGAYLKALSPQAEKGIQIIPPAGLNWWAPSGEMHRESANEVAARLPVDVLYLDPPYNERQYAKYYHVPEVLASLHLQPDLEAFEDALYGKTGIHAFADRLSDYCTKIGAERGFADLFQRARAKHIVLSYSNEGLLSKAAILDLLICAGWSEVECDEIAYRRFKSDGDNKREHAAKGVTEFLFYGRR